MAAIYKHKTSSGGGPNTTPLKVVGAGTGVIAGHKLLKSLEGSVDRTAEKLDDNNNNLANFLSGETTENTSFKIESSEIVDALFGLPLEETTLKEKITSKNFVAFKSFNKYVK